MLAFPAVDPRDGLFSGQSKSTVPGAGLDPNNVADIQHILSPEKGFMTPASARPASARPLRRGCEASSVGLRRGDF